MKTRLVKVGRFVYRVRLQPDFDGGNAIYVNGSLVADVDHYPSDQEIVQVVEDNIKLETTIKTGFAQSGVFE